MKWNSNLYDNSHDFVARYGEGIFSYLQPSAGETILDLGCGTGDLTYKIAMAGAEVVGVDSSADMVSQAKTKFPEISFYQVDARKLEFDSPFDAIFSNAVLHWIPEKEQVIQGMKYCLKPGGRLVLEFGGKGNLEQMIVALKEVLAKSNYPENAKINFWYFPSIGEYASELEKHGFRVVHAEHFDRMTPLNGPDGMKNWFRMFGGNFLAGIPANEQEALLTKVQETLRSTHFQNNTWFADYRRIRIVAINE